VTHYAELQATSNFSFLRGASHVEELFAAAAHLGIEGLGIADRGSLAGIVRAHEAARTTGVRLVVGARLDLSDAPRVLVYPTDRPAYARLCRLLTLGKGRAGKGGCKLAWDDLAEYGEGLLAVLAPDKGDTHSPHLRGEGPPSLSGRAEGITAHIGRLRADFGDRAYLALTLRRRPGDARRLDDLANLAAKHRVPTVATGDVLYHAPERRILQDVLTCIREGVTIDALGFKRERYADRHLKPPEEMARLFARHSAAVARSIEILDRCKFSLDELRYQYPREAVLPGMTPIEALERLTWEGAKDRYPGGVPEKVAGQLAHELKLIADLDYAPYFLTVHSIVAFAQSKGILCQGRGSAANSAVCYVLGVTAVDPEKSDLLFERFVSEARREPPDIDVDFDSDRREEVIQWIFETYGRERAALCATVIRYRARGAIRDVGKVMGISQDVTAALASQVWGWSRDGAGEDQAKALNLNTGDRRLKMTLDLAKQLIGFPRHLSQHPGGFVLSQDRLDDLVPIEPARMADRQVIEWDKDDIAALRFMKVDVLGLGMMGALAKAFDLLREHKDLDLSLAAIPAEDPETYAMIQKADTIGVFQIESRAQMSMLPRLKPKTFYDLVIEVAIVRPGPIQGDMVHPYLRRREGKEPVSYPSPQFERVLGKTLGIPLFQEQAMNVAIQCAGFTAAEADALRRSMATFKVTGGVAHFKDKLVAGMVKNGYARDFAERTFRQIEGFGSYGFPESHAASFALLAYASSWLKRHHPDVFLAALLNSQPMGFYAPAQLVRDARNHSIEVRPIDVNMSRWDATLENHPSPNLWGEGAELAPEPVSAPHPRIKSGAGSNSLPARGRGEGTASRERLGTSFPRSESVRAVRLGLRLVKGLANAEAATIAVARGEAPYRSVEDLWLRAKPSRAALECLARADAFGSLGLSRRQALWDIRALAPEPLPLFAAAEAIAELAVALPAMPDGQEVVEDYRHAGLTLRDHPLAFIRADLTAAGYAPISHINDTRDRARLALAGLVLVRQMPGSAKGVLFVTVEDESGTANLIVWPKVFERFRRVILSARLLGAHGRLQREGEVTHLVVDRLADLSALLARVGERGGAFPLPDGRGEDARTGGAPDRRLAKAEGFQSRNLFEPPGGQPGNIKVRTRDFR